MRESEEASATVSASSAENASSAMELDAKQVNAQFKSPFHCASEVSHMTFQHVAGAVDDPSSSIITDAMMEEERRLQVCHLSAQETLP